MVPAPPRMIRDLAVVCTLGWGPSHAPAAAVAGAGAVYLLAQYLLQCGGHDAVLRVDVLQLGLRGGHTHSSERA